jgi:multidrug resistance efflux pump
MTAEPKKAKAAPRSETRQRAKRETIRFLDEEHAAIRAKAESAGLSFGAYLRACALGDAGPRARRSPTIDRKVAAQAIAELNKAGSNLNQIAHAVNMKNWPGRAPVERATAAVNRAALQILQAFGYKTHDRERQPA